MVKIATAKDQVYNVLQHVKCKNCLERDRNNLKLRENDVTEQESVSNIVSESDLFTERDEDYINNISSIFNSNETKLQKENILIAKNSIR